MKIHIHFLLKVEQGKALKICGKTCLKIYAEQEKNVNVLTSICQLAININWLKAEEDSKA